MRHRRRAVPFRLINVKTGKASTSRTARREPARRSCSPPSPTGRASCGRSDRPGFATDRQRPQRPLDQHPAEEQREPTAAHPVDGRGRANRTSAGSSTSTDKRSASRPAGTTSSSPRPTSRTPTARSSNCSREAATKSSGKSSRSAGKAPVQTLKIGSNKIDWAERDPVRAGSIMQRECRRNPSGGDGTITFETVRKLVLELPGVVEGTSSGTPAHSGRGRPCSSGSTRMANPSSSGSTTTSAPCG